MILYIPFTLQDYFLGVTHFVFMTQHIAQGDPHMFDFCEMTNGMLFFHMLKICYLSKLGGTFDRLYFSYASKNELLKDIVWKYTTTDTTTTGLHAFLISFTWISCFISLFFIWFIALIFLIFLSQLVGNLIVMPVLSVTYIHHSSSECGAADRFERYHWNCRHMELE